MSQSTDAISDLRTIFHANTGGTLTDSQSRRVLEGLLSVRDTARALNELPKHLFQAVCENRNFYGKAVYPCDVIDLRRVLESQTIFSNRGVVLFSLGAAKRLIQDYPCLLMLKIDPEKIAQNGECILAGGVVVCDTSSLEFENEIVGIILQNRAPFETVEKIVEDTIPECPIYSNDFVPGLERDKFASSEKRYFVNLPALGIPGWLIKAPSDQEAVGRALARRWNRLPMSKNQEKPDRFTADYWLKSGFWKSIVREAGKKKDEPMDMTKQAQATGPTLNLTPDEQSVFQTILAIDKEFGLGQQYRVAGGWIRDRLLGVQSDDLDIALDKMTGQQFLQYAKQYKEKHPESSIGKDYVVQANAERSKHLETTALEIGPFKIDFVNLRTENYADDSRVPTMQFGSPEVDAQRRDLTINAMFYNINTGQVEDYVGGLQDIQSMTLRTPLDPVQTFMDDPLRMLRVLRFNSRYPAAKISPDVIQAMSNPQVHEAYRAKVAPERAGPEILKMFGGEKPDDSLAILYDTGMDQAVLNLPDFKSLHPFDMNQRNPHHEFNVREHTFGVLKAYNSILKQQEASGVISKKDRTLGLIAAWFHDYGKLHPEIGKPKADNPNHYQYIGHEDVSAQLSDVFLKQIGIGGDDREFVNTIVREHMIPHNDVWNSRMMGNLRRKTTIPGQERADVWKFVMWHAKADDSAKGSQVDPESQSMYDQRFDQTQQYFDKPPPPKPFLDGRVLMQIFPGLDPKSGFIKDIQTRLLSEQDAQNIQTPEQAQSYVESIRAEIEGKYMPNRQASNWYQNVKQADASSGAGPDSFNAGPDSNPAKDREKDVKHMIRYEPGENSVWRVGDRVRRRNVGLADNSSMGRVVDKNGPKFKVQWEGAGNTQVFNTDDIKTMSLIERV